MNADAAAYLAERTCVQRCWASNWRPPVKSSLPGLLDYLYLGVKLGIYPCLIFLGVGATHGLRSPDRQPQDPAAGRCRAAGYLHDLHRALLLSGLHACRKRLPSASSAARTAPRPSSLTSKLAPHLLGPIAVAAYSYMALVPVIQPPIMKRADHQEGALHRDGAAAARFPRRKRSFSPSS